MWPRRGFYADCVANVYTLCSFKIYGVYPLFRLGSPALDDAESVLRPRKRQDIVVLGSSFLVCLTMKRSLFNQGGRYFLKATKPCAVAYGCARIRRLVRLGAAR